MSKGEKVYGNIPEAIVAGIILIALLNHMQLVGFILAGFAIGLIARGAMRGLLSGLLAGVIISLLSMIFVLFLPDYGIKMINTFLGNNLLTVPITATLRFLGSQPSNSLIRQLIIDGTVLPAIGAFIGGAILSQGYDYSEEGEEMDEVIQKSPE
ncbi:hypothetical protein OXIME_001517 [Oxyplasma meridianum]|uniref:Uncharacterized protein n=1 Tax=Oxyplasma meridianum TaxID=3073602 RepID=A0AAX4NHL2_9ARCH